MAKRTSGTRSTVVRCPNCGEDYSVTYKRCPFCDERAPRRRRKPEEEEPIEYDEDCVATRGGKRLKGRKQKRSWSILGVLGTLIPLAVIAAAIWIVVTQIRPLITGAKPTPPSVSAQPAQTIQPAASYPVDTAEPSPEVSAEPTPTPDPIYQIPSTQTATGFTLSHSDVSLKVGDPVDGSFKLRAKFTPAGSIGFITWSVDKPEVATVAEDGTVRAVSRGTANVTGTMAGGVAKTCIVRVSGSAASAPAASEPPASSAPAPTPTASQAPSSGSNAKLNREDFSFSYKGETWQMKVSGTDSTPAWSIGNTDVATISDTGKVTAVGSGTTTITCTVDGQTLKCIVRCQF